MFRSISQAIPGRVTLDEIANVIGLTKDQLQGLGRSEINPAEPVQRSGEGILLGNDVLCTQDTKETKETSDTKETQDREKRELVRRANDQRSVIEERDSVDMHINAEIDEAVAACALGGATLRRDPLFDLARMIAGIECRHHFSCSPLLRLDMFERWRDRSGELSTAEDTFEMFLAKFGKVQRPYGYTLQSAFERAKTKPAPIRVRPLSQGLQDIAKLCRELQVLAEGNPFFLPCRQAGQVLRIPYRTAATHLLALQTLGVIKLVFKGEKAAKLGSTYRYIADYPPAENYTGAH